jgi:hypothetical protein
MSGYFDFRSAARNGLSVSSLRGHSHPAVHRQTGAATDYERDAELAVAMRPITGQSVHGDPRAIRATFLGGLVGRVGGFRPCFNIANVRCIRLPSSQELHVRQLKFPLNYSKGCASRIVQAAPYWRFASICVNESV